MEGDAEFGSGLQARAIRQNAERRPGHRGLPPSKSVWHILRQLPILSLDC